MCFRKFEFSLRVCFIFMLEFVKFGFIFLCFLAVSYWDIHSIKLKLLTNILCTDHFANSFFVAYLTLCFFMKKGNQKMRINKL